MKIIRKRVLVSVYVPLLVATGGLAVTGSSGNAKGKDEVDICIRCAANSL